MDPILVYIQKLKHPLKEIRERSIKLLLAKIQCGWELQDELATTRDLIEALLAWFDVEQPALQREALELLLTTIKTKGGTCIVKQLGICKIIRKLNRLKTNINVDALEILQDIMETLCFLNTIDSEVTLGVPPLDLLSVERSQSSNKSGCYNTYVERQTSSETLATNGFDNKTSHIASDGIRCLLFPWIDLGPSDVKTITLIEDSLKLLKSTRRCCRFIKDVFIRDFPASIFLNRPTIIKSLLAISEGHCGGYPGEALHVLLCISQALNKQFKQLFCKDLVSESHKIPNDQEEPDDNINIELQTDIESGREAQPDMLLALRQIPIPVFALDTSHAILTILARTIIPDECDNNGASNMADIHTCLCLIESLLMLLLASVGEQFWRVEHNSKTHRDIAHKACMVMRMMGDLLMKYRKSFESNPETVEFRIAWLRLVPCAERLLHWAKDSALPPSILVTALQMAQIDPALDPLYPTVCKRITNVLQTSKSSVDQEYKSKYRELMKLYDSMEHAVQFKIIKESRSIEKNLTSMVKTLPIFHFNLDKEYFKELVIVLFDIVKQLDVNDSQWSVIRDTALKLMAHSVMWVRVTFYVMLMEFIRTAFVGDERNQEENEKCLKLICHVEILTEICCQGLSSDEAEIEANSSEIMLFVLRGRLVLSDGSWWRLLASLLPVLPLLHVYAAHDTELGKAICKSLEEDIVSCMGVSNAHMTAGLARLLFVKCGAVQLDAAHSLCRLLDDKKYLPPRESLRADILLNAMRRIESQNFNIDETSSSSEDPPTPGLLQILDVLKQDLTLDDDGLTYIAKEGTAQATLEPSLRRSSLQQLAVMMRQQDIHETFLNNNGLNLIVSLLRLSLMVDDYLAFPECAISCVSVLNSISFMNRHSLTQIADLPHLLLRVILVFPANESSVSLSAQVLAASCWSGFALLELAGRRRLLSLPLAVAARVQLPFPVATYWNKSPNTEHSRIDWLMSEPCWRSAVFFRWWWVGAGGAAIVRAGYPLPSPSVAGHPAPSPSTGPPPTAGYLSPSPTAGNLSPPAAALAAALASSLPAACAKALLALENATSHHQVIQAVSLLQSYLPLWQLGVSREASLPWRHTRRFLRAPPASARDVNLLTTLLHCLTTYMDHVTEQDTDMSWIKSSFIGDDAAVISLLGRNQLYPQQTVQDDLAITQLRINIVKVIVRCIVLVEHDGDYSCKKMESLIKILLASLEMIDLKNFHMLGYLNELMRCIRYAVYSRYCELSEDTLISCLRVMTGTLGGCASGSGRKGQACRLDAVLAVLAIITQLHQQAIPIQRWSEWFSGAHMRVYVRESGAARAELRAAALHTLAALARHPQLLPHIQQCVPSGSLVEFALGVFCGEGEANVVRAAAGALLTALTARPSAHAQAQENEILRAMYELNFIDECLNILVEFCREKDYNVTIEPNVPMSVYEREAELEVRAQKCDIYLSPSSRFQRAPPTPGLAAAVADVIHNICTWKGAHVKTWNEQGLFRILFKCASWCNGDSGEVARVRSTSCRALVAASSQRCVRAALAHTLDCIHDFLATLTRTGTISAENTSGFPARTQALLLLATLVQEQAASDTVWLELRKEHSVGFFVSLLASLDSENSELQEAAVYCLSTLARSMSEERQEAKDESRVSVFENIRSVQEGEPRDRLSAGDQPRCRPAYLAETYCQLLLRLHRDHAPGDVCLSSQNDSWRRVSSCLCALWRVSARARLQAAHEGAVRSLAGTLQRVRDALSLSGKTVDVIRNANNEPILETLHWTLTLMSCLMSDCTPVKELFAEEHVETSLTRLWPWCMMTETLRTDLINMIVNFTNDCPKAWGRACSCVCGRSVVGETCALAVREAARARPSLLLPLAFTALTHCAAHHHARAIIIKSEVLPCAVRCTGRGGGAGAAAAARLCAALARHADGAGALLGTPRPVPPPRRLLPALAHVAHHHRHAALQAADILELLSTCLLTGDVSEVVSAARAVWALAANNYRAKLILRGSGVLSAVQSSLQRIQKLSDSESQRALQLLTYTITVLQAA